VSRYAQLYDKRGGASEIEIKEDKQASAWSNGRSEKPRLKSMLVLLNQLAQTADVGARRLTEAAPKLRTSASVRLFGI
jgi:hypothetical protein